MATERTEQQAFGPNSDPRIGCFIEKWASLANGEQGDAFQMPNADIVMVQVYGTFGGATVVIQGALDNSDPTYSSMRDSAGTALSITSAGVFKLEGPATLIRPSISGGGPTTALSVVILGVVSSKG